MLEHKKSKIDQYVDTSGQFSSRQLKIGTWYLLHRELFREIFIGFLITLCVVFYGFGLWKWGEYLFFGYWNDQEYLAKYTQTNQNYSSIQEIYKAQDLNVADVRVFATSENMYDFVASIQNPNERWIAKVTYHFVYSGIESQIETAIIIPLSKRPVALFGVESNAFPANTNFVIDNIEWESVDAHDVPDVKNFIAERNLFQADNFIVSDASLSGLSFPVISFDLINSSAFNYWEPVFLVELLNGSQVIGYVYLYFEKMAAFSTESVELRYFSQVAEFNNFRIIPIINFFDDNIYINPGDF
ncbi:MAG: hypothetical protein A2725_02285 [Candidatus Magasanikbacteria bacterium RIFCSPHIGHO2_01_FULL_33_34]|uniref:Uncharacterized protein n=1 Tax=Candidatus Magasanikbacteria bacterium RIFCSPHIGHO2_01_FULL_33_34 TaxID=1798671 RepID=A0A1F6LKI6_9BACT|nr:MAG: hypothetical protein A2725_02285 [Candidatus Magasanikbacteria bacterium RIFCSPHIGHO2_01_FULL_33_34]OGH65648.1 MAG: hypothetical protein A3B83_02115 [Candidatus Magasanikbacteria bacterium RIFCSPHIGHO2_02_FULL_33_17]OGH75857.1 MAG: hypothetical protein A3A89_03010 [Candidatus Magasanikbacteria bacterium RIFCSPLOWO2_01_FULL_33_34]